MNPEHIIGLDIPEGSRLLDSVLVTEASGLHMYSPGVTVAEDDDWETGHFKATFESYDVQPIAVVNRSQIFVEEESLLGSHRVLDVDHFKFKKLEDILEYIQTHRAISFVIENRATQLMFLGDCYRKLTSKFKYTQLGAFHTYTGYPVGLACCVTFVGLKYGVPMYADPRKVRGCLMKVAGFDVTSKIPGMITRFDVLLTDEDSGVLSIDGGPIWNRNPICDGHVSEIHKSFRTCRGEKRDGVGGLAPKRPKMTKEDLMSEKRFAEARAEHKKKVLRGRKKKRPSRRRSPEGIIIPNTGGMATSNTASTTSTSFGYSFDSSASWARYS